MLFNDILKLITITEVKNEIGEVKKVENTEREIRCIIQPVKNEIDIKMYGIYQNKILNVFTYEDIPLGATVKFYFDRYIVRDSKDYGKLKQYVIEMM